MSAQPVTHKTIEELYDAVHGDSLLLLAESEFWLAWENEDGDWYAVRPRNEEDPEGPEGDRFRPVGPRRLESVKFPVTVVGVSDALESRPDYAKAYSDAMWALDIDRQGGA